MGMKLVVTQAFASYQAGEEITNPDEVAAVLDGGNAPNVVKVAAPDAQATTKKAAKAADSAA